MNDNSAVIKQDGHQGFLQVRIARVCGVCDNRYLGGLRLVTERGSEASYKGCYQYYLYLPERKWVKGVCDVI